MCDNSDSRDDKAALLADLLVLDSNGGACRIWYVKFEVDGIMFGLKCRLLESERAGRSLQCGSSNKTTEEDKTDPTGPEKRKISTCSRHNVERKNTWLDEEQEI